MIELLFFESSLMVQHLLQSYTKLKAEERERERERERAK